MAVNIISYDPAIKGRINLISEAGQRPANVSKDISIQGNTNLPAAKKFCEINRIIKSLLEEMQGLVNKDAASAIAAFETIEKNDMVVGQSYKIQ